MRKLREFLRLHFENKLSGRAIAKSASISPSTAQGYLGRIRVAGLTWPLPAKLDSDEALSRALFPEDCVWEEYKAGQPDGYQYSAFCLRFTAWVGKLQLSMRQEHRVGEKLFIDFSGDGIDIIDPKTGETSQRSSSSRCSAPAATPTSRRSCARICRPGCNAT